MSTQAVLRFIDPLDSFKRSGLDIDLYNLFLTTEEEQELFQAIEENVTWLTAITKGKRSNQMYGDPGLIYELRFGGYGDRPLKITHRKTIPWSEFPLLDKIKSKVELQIGKKFNFCAIQRYPNGGVGMSRHRDSEMVAGTCIAGLSLHTERILTMTPIRSSEDPITLDLLPGSLYVLKPPTNDRWMHAIEKNDSITPRISLTFRDVPQVNKE